MKLFKTLINSVIWSMVLIILLSLKYYQFDEIGFRWFQNGAVLKGVVWFTLVLSGLQLILNGFGLVWQGIKSRVLG